MNRHYHCKGGGGGGGEVVFVSMWTILRHWALALDTDQRSRTHQKERGSNNCQFDANDVAIARNADLQLKKGTQDRWILPARKQTD